MQHDASDFDEMAYIAFLSTVFANSRPTFGYHLLRTGTKEGQVRSKIWQCLALLLNTGGGPSAAGKSVAVTGCMYPHGVTVLITSSSGASPLHLDAPPTFTTLKSDSAKGFEILCSPARAEWKDADTFEGHIQDVLNVIQYCMTPSDELAQNALSVALKVVHLFQFAVYRCRRKLLARLKAGRQIWSFGDQAALPTTFIHDMHETLKNGPNGVWVPYESFVSLPASRLEVVVEGVTEGLEGRMLFYNLYGLMMRLKSLLKSDVLKFIITSEIKERLDDARERGSTTRLSEVETLIMEATGARHKSGGAVEEAPAQNEEGMSVDAFPEDGENVKDHLVRYLEALIVPLDIVSTMLALPAPSPAPPVTAILIDDGPRVPLNARPFVDDILKEVQDVLTGKELNVATTELQKALDDAAAKVSVATVHPASALMARALSVHPNSAALPLLDEQSTSTEVLHLMRDIFQVRPGAIDGNDH
ncbi:uncharacterized protein BXZ73DRAFT_101805 [Epithele typhae]|uniref:uncharacterized protein n=1 Tax=Epithele typhae TaxID=378194 RepID=UPI0020080997|nr:uncharacterized protein BXZ73DRAFT_101805 [Epithele typhae]KAH9930430.1 hypothetical protein BXZ73DRAFT_101805 [Epithele typhae]